MNASRRRWVIVARSVLTVALLVGLAWPASAAGVGGLFFSEYVEGSAGNQALEVYNATAGTVDLAAGKYSVEFYFDGAATPSRVIALTGKVGAGQVYVLANAAGAPALRERADQLEGGAWFDGNDAVVLKRGAVRLDVIGQVGFDPGRAWGSHWISTADSTLRKMKSYCQGDSNASDRFDPLGPWQGSDVDTFDGLGVHAAECLTLPVPLWLLFLLMAALCAGAVWWLDRRRINLGIVSTFLKWLTAIVLLTPFALFVVERSDARTILLAALVEMGLIGTIGGVIVGRREDEGWVGAVQWLPAILFSYVPIAISFSDAGARLNNLPGYNEWAMIGIHLLCYQAAFWITHRIKRARR